MLDVDKGELVEPGELLIEGEHIVEVAPSVLRALATARSVRTAGSSWTAFNGLRWSGPPSSRLTSMSIRPGSRMASPKSTISPAGSPPSPEQSWSR